MAVPINYRKASEPALASYDFTDLATGEGVEDLYGLKYISGATTFYKLYGESSAWSDSVMTSGAFTSGAGYVKELDLDFDLDFNIPRTIKGTAILNVPHGHVSRQSSCTMRQWVNARIRKWDGTTETEIVEASGAELRSINVGINDIKNAMDAIRLKIPETDFKTGETLRLTVELWALGQNGGFYVGHDPKNRATSDKGSDVTLTFGTDPSTMVLHTPFLIDL